MITKAGFPRFQNAHDWADSIIINAWLVFLKHPWAINPETYYQLGRPVRFPFGPSRDDGGERLWYLETSPRCVSGDQIAMLVWSEKVHNGKSQFEPRWWGPNDLNEDDGKYKVPDFFQPAMRGHLKRCYGENSNMIEDWFLLRDFDINGKIDPMGEQNQLQAMAIVAGKVYVQEYVRTNRCWADATLKYYDDQAVVWNPHENKFTKAYSRGERDIGIRIVNAIEEMVL